MNPALPLLKPDLYARDANGRAVLTGGKCSACGHMFFPMQQRGCEHCGAHGRQLEPVDLGGDGELVSAATVNLHAGKGRTAPFVIGVVDLDSGPRVRTLCDNVPDPETAAGIRVTAHLVEVSSHDGGAALDLRFRSA